MIRVGETAELIAKEFDISREEQDRFALRSHQKAAAAMKDGRHSRAVLGAYFKITPTILSPHDKEVFRLEVTMDGC